MTKFIAHRGFGKEKKGNTLTAFQCAADSAVYGVETDVRITKDGIFVAFHDKSTANLCGKHKVIEKTNYKDVQKLKVLDGLRRHCVPLFMDYLRNCKSNRKIAVVEIKSNLSKEQTETLVELISDNNYLSNTIFISFNRRVLKYIRKLLPKQPIQMLTIKYREEDLDFLQENKFDIDISHLQLTKERIAEFHKRGIFVNCWTVNGSRRSKNLQQWGVDFITTDKIAISDNEIS